MSNGDDEEAVAGIGDTGKGIVPGQESSEKGKEAAGLDDAGGGRAISANKVTNTEQEEGHVQSEEEGEESHGGAEGTDQQDEGEDEPALLMSVFFYSLRKSGREKYHQEETERVVEHGRAAIVGS